MKYAVLTLGIMFCLTSAIMAEEVVYDASQDTEVDEQLADMNFGAEEDLEVHADWEDPPTWIVKALFQFPIDIESWALVDQAILQLHVLDNSIDPGPLDIFRATEDWTEMSVTWNTRPGEDRVLVVSENAPPVQLVPVLWELNVTDIVQAWVNGSFENHGFYIDVPDNNNWVDVDLATRENPDPDIRPKLWINYWLDNVEEDPVENLSLSVTPVSKHSVAINLSLPVSTPATLSIFDASGALVQTFNPQSGNQSISWTGKPGVYFVRLATNQATYVEKAVIVN